MADIPQTLLAYVEFLKRDIEDFTGMTDFATGQSSRSVQTSGGINSMIERSLVGDQDEFTLFEQFIEKLTYLMLSNAIEYYTDDRVMRMRNDNPNSDAEFEYIPFKSEEFADLAWDFSLDIVKKIRHNDQTRQDIMRMLSEWQLQYSPDLQIVTPEDIVKSFNPPNRDAILERLAQDKKQKSYDTAAQVVQEVVQALDSGYDPELVAEIVYKILNPEQQKMGDVQKRQEGISNN